MLIVADVHGATAALRRIAGLGEPLVVLGDLINFIDYRTNDGIVTEIAGRPFVAEMVRLRTAGQFEQARHQWRSFVAGREHEVQRAFERETTAAYREVCAALEGSGAYVTYGNVDRPDLLAASLPNGCRFVDGEVVVIEGVRMGIVGGGMVSLGTPGEVTEEQTAAKLERLGPVDVLGSHLPPAVPALSNDVIGGRAKGSEAILDYLVRQRPRWHYFGDVHQPQATAWRVGTTRCINVGYFRATGRAVRHLASPDR